MSVYIRVAVNTWLNCSFFYINFVITGNGEATIEYDLNDITLQITQTRIYSYSSGNSIRK